MPGVAQRWIISMVVLVLFAGVSAWPQVRSNWGSFVDRLPIIGKPAMPDMTGALLIEVVENPCGDGRDGAVKVLPDAQRRRIGLYLSDDPNRPFAVVDKSQSPTVVYLDYDRDGRVDAKSDGSGTICNDVAKTPRKISAPVILPEKNLKVTM